MHDRPKPWRQRNRPMPGNDRVVDESEIVRVSTSIFKRVVADDNRAFPEMGCDEYHCWPGHGNPNLDQHEINRSVDPLECFAQV